MKKVILISTIIFSCMHLGVHTFANTWTRVNMDVEGPEIYVEVIINYGVNIVEELNKFKNKCVKEIEMF